MRLFFNIILPSHVYSTLSERGWQKAMIDSLPVIIYNAVVSKLGHHIITCGPTDSGKSTLAGQISQRIGMPHIELDAIFWKPGWVESPMDEFRAGVSAALSRCADGWVCDGNYSRVRDLTFPLADTVVWLRPSFRVAFWRLLNRTIARCRDGKVICGTNRETWKGAFFSRDSLLLYQITHWRGFDKRTTESLEIIPHHASVIQLRTQKEVDAFLGELGGDCSFCIRTCGYATMSY